MCTARQEINSVTSSRQHRTEVTADPAGPDYRDLQWGLGVSTAASAAERTGCTGGIVRRERPGSDVARSVRCTDGAREPGPGAVHECGDTAKQLLAADAGHAHDPPVGDDGGA